MPHKIKTHCVHGHARTPDNVRSNGACRTCANAVSVRAARRRMQNDPEDVRRKRKLWQQTESGKRSVQNSHLKVTHGITLDEQEIMLRNQSGKCAICKVILDSSSKPFVPCIDHKHEPGRRRGKHQVRGLLCHFCNILLGVAKDNETTLQAAIDYLRKHALKLEAAA